MKFNKEYVDSIMNHINKVLEKLSEKYNTPPVKAIISPYVYKKDRLGEYDYNNFRILLAPELLFKEQKDIMSAVCHEFRHHWQYTKGYKDILLWWMKKENKELYKEYYYKKECSIEYDAFIFGDSFGEENGEWVLKKYSIEWLNEYFKRS